MVKKAKKEIIDKINELWNDRKYAWRDLDIEVRIYSDKTEIDISSMYEAPGLKFSYLRSLAEFFETENINDDNAFNEKGCDTCDYGSKYGYTLTIRPDKK